MKAAVLLVYLYLFLRNSIRKPRKGVQNERSRATLLSFNVSFLENPTEYPHKPYTAKKLDSMPEICAADSMCLSFFSFHAITFRTCTM